MRLKCLVCLLLASLTFGQAPTPMTPPRAPSPNKRPAATGQASAGTDKAPEAKAPDVGPNDTVITIKGFCPGSSEQGDACKNRDHARAIRQLADALQPNMSPAIRRQLATRYSWALKMSPTRRSAASTKSHPSKKRCGGRACRFFAGIEHRAASGFGQSYRRRRRRLLQEK